MANLSKTARASAGQQAVKEDPFKTKEQKIEGLLKLRVNDLFVTRMDFVDALLEDYRRLVGAEVMNLEALRLADESFAVVDNTRKVADEMNIDLRVVITRLESELMLAHNRIEEMVNVDIVRVRDTSRLAFERDEARELYEVLKKNVGADKLLFPQIGRAHV